MCCRFIIRKAWVYIFTLYRASNFDNPRASYLIGLSTDIKPLDQLNGASFEEIDTGDIYRFDEENKIWYKGVLTWLSK